MKVKLVALLMSALLVSACSNQAAPAKTEKNNNQATNTTQTTPNGDANTNQPTPNQSTNGSASNASKETKANNSDSFFKSILSDAKSGKMMFLTDEFGFKIGTSSSEITKKWGKPESEDANKLDYNINHNVIFYVMEGKVIEIQSSHAKFQNIVDLMKKQLGKPASTKKTQDGKTLYSYPAGKYQFGVYASGNNIESIAVIKPISH